MTNSTSGRKKRGTGAPSVRVLYTAEQVLALNLRIDSWKIPANFSSAKERVVPMFQGVAVSTPYPMSILDLMELHPDVYAGLHHMLQPTRDLKKSHGFIQATALTTMLSFWEESHRKKVNAVFAKLTGLHASLAIEQVRDLFFSSGETRVMLSTDVIEMDKTPCGIVVAHPWDLMQLQLAPAQLDNAAPGWRHRLLASIALGLDGKEHADFVLGISHAPSLDQVELPDAMPSELLP